MNCIDPLSSLRGKQWKIYIPSRGIQKQAQQNETSLTTKQDFSFLSCQSLASLTFMQLVSGADQVVRHICIQCISIKQQVQ